MKKPTVANPKVTDKKLPLRTSVVRRLSPDELDAVAGGDCCASCALTCHGNNVTQ